MYVPPSNAEHDPAVLHAFIEANPLGALVTASADGLFATHIPFVANPERGVLEGHVARANEHHRRPAVTREALVIFTGPDAYVTPTWYPEKGDHGRVVPTWNYVAVHAYGTLAWVNDAEFLHRHLAELTRRHEAARERPWAMEDAPADFITAQAKAIVGVELTLTRMVGKWKMSQNRSDADIDNVVRGLAASPRLEDRSVEYCRRAPGSPYQALALTFATLSPDGSCIAEKLSFLSDGLLAALGFPPYLD